MKTILLTFAVMVFAATPTVASGPSIWTVNSRDDVMKGEAKNVSIDSTGSISLAPKLSEVFRTEQSYIWSMAVDQKGAVYIGTGADGRIFRIESNGQGKLFTDLGELNVSAIVMGLNGEIFAASSPDGNVYRIDASGKADLYFAAGEKYIWSFLSSADGSLIVGTGDHGKVYRVRSAGQTAASSLLFDSSDEHIISLAADRLGNVFAGTDSNGLVLRIAPDGKVFALVDSPLQEIHSVAVANDGTVYALAISDAIAAKPAASPENKKTEKKPVASANEAPKSRYDLTGVKSAIYRIGSNGGSEIIWSSKTIVGFSVLAEPDASGVTLGTSDRGRVYGIDNSGRETLVAQTDTNQISVMRRAGNDILAASSNPGTLFRIAGTDAAEGTYESSVLDAKVSASWGRIWWRSAGVVKFETRSGNTSEPDEIWSAWQPVSEGKIKSPQAQFFQYRAILRSGTSKARLDEVNVAYVTKNIAPEILGIQLMPYNVALLPNPSVPVDPNIAAAGLDPAFLGLPATTVAPRKVFQRGARAFQWTVEDRNGDSMVYDVFFKEAGEIAYKKLADGISENFYTIDGQSLADGSYTVKIAARDTPDNTAGSGLMGTMISDPFTVDNTQPIVKVVGQPSASGQTSTVVFGATDAAGYLVKAEYSVNGGDWMPVFPVDGIADSPEETFNIDFLNLSKGENSVVLRVFDSSGNAGTGRSLITR